MVAAGRARAASVGWPDAYAFTKALGERSLVETRDGVPVAIVRPSIIESALSPNRCRAGFAASVWPSRSSPPTPEAFSKSSPGCPRVSSTSSPSTSWLLRSSPPPLAVRTSASNPASTSPTSSRSHRDRQTPSSTARWSTSCRPTSPKTRSTTKRTSPSRCPTGPSPAVAG
ncbi:MAG: hypothetical protein EBY44_04260 [Actinobacteria bacterium]|nr:hypothetical protein [Actinomycetota bacterium]